jgi:hypothetical protein
MMFPKPEKKQREPRRNSLQQRKKPKKETAPWRQGILSHHQDRPSGADRGEFPAKIVKELIAEADGICQSCRTAPDTTTHHIMPRGRRSSPGRGVKTNGLRLCGPCHDRIQTHEDELQHWIEVYRQRHGERFWFDEIDQQEYERKQAEVQAEEELQRLRLEELAPLMQILRDSVGRPLRPDEKKFVHGLSDKHIAILAGLIRATMGTGVPDRGYGWFKD